MAKQRKAQATGPQWRDLRDWLELVDALGELKHVRGASSEEDIGAVTEMLDHADESPCVLFDEIPPTLEVRDHDALGEPGSRGEDVLDGLHEVGGVIGAKQQYRIPIYLRHAHDISSESDKLRIPVEVGSDVVYAVCFQLVDNLGHPPGVDLPERGRQILNQFAVSLLALT